MCASRLQDPGRARLDTGRAVAMGLAGLMVATAACTPPRLAMTALTDARRLGAGLHVAFAAAAESSNRAVMAGTEAAAAGAADEARQARQVVTHHAAALGPLLTSLRYERDARILAEFRARYGEYAPLDDEVLALAVESSNVKAQRLSFGEGRAAAEAVVNAVEAAARGRRTADARLDAVALRAVLGVREIQTLQAPHIAEADDAAMNALELRMRVAAGSSRSALEVLFAGQAAETRLAAMAAFDRFLTVNTEVVALSRRNTNVRSLALALGRKRALAAECDDRLRQLDDALAAHEFSATR